MRVTPFLATLPLLLKPVTAFPWMAIGGDPEVVKHGLAAMSADPELMAEIRDLMDEQAAELEAWKRAGKRDLIGGVIGVIGGILDAVIGPVDGILAGVLSTFPSSIEGSKKFPEPDYPFKAPGPTDQRGPCPGLNTLANHGYLPRSGIVTAGQAIRATSQVFNMGADLAAVLVAGAVALNGDIQTLTFSLGGADARTNSLGKLGGLLGTETGLDGHGRVNEGDASATRCDFYLCGGDNHNMRPELFKQMLDRAKEHGNQFNVDALAEHFHNRYADSKSRNPNFYFVPPSALIVMGATYFHAGFFTNGTIGAGGSSNIASIASFNGAHFKSDGSIEYVPERIPEQGWYRRAVPMTLAEALAGILAIYSKPYPVAFGGNAGSTSNFVPGPGLLPTDIQDVNGLGCFLYNALYADFFGEFQNILFGVEGAVDAILGLLDPALGDFINCTPNFPDETDPNSYGGAWKYMNATANTPGASQKQPCLNGAGTGQCRTDTNTYATTDWVSNRFEFKGAIADGANPKP